MVTEAPSRLATLERVRSLSNVAVYTVALQHRRLRHPEPVGEFIMQPWADFSFLIIALCRLERIVGILKGDAVIDAALSEFNAALPGIRKLRDIGEHVDEYAIDSPSRHRKGYGRAGLQVATFDGVTFEWYDQSVNIDDALAVAQTLFAAVQAVTPRPEGWTVS